MKTFFREILATLALAIVIFILLQTTIQSTVVVGPSMEPDFRDGQRLLVNKAVYAFHEPERGDVIIFHSPHSSRTDFIKRIIGLPGDTVEIKQGVVYVNSSPLYEPYIADPPHYTLQKQEVTPNSYFVLGDNRNNSNDSHNGWTVPRQNIIGKAWLSIWPPTEWGLAPNYPLQEQLTSFINKPVTILIKGWIWQQK